MYNIKSRQTEEFINHQEILDTLEYAQANRNNRPLIESLIDKAALCQVAHKMLPTFTLIGSPVVTLLHKLDTQRAQPAWQPDDSEAATQMMTELQRLIDALEG